MQLMALRSIVTTVVMPVMQPLWMWRDMLPRARISYEERKVSESRYWFFKISLLRQAHTSHGHPCGVVEERGGKKSQRDE